MPHAYNGRLAGTNGGNLKSKAMNPTPETICRAHCNRCLGERSHDVLHREEQTWEEPLDEDGHHSIWGGDRYELLKCRGCAHIALRHSTWFSEDTDDRGQPFVKVAYHPPAVSRQAPDWLDDLVDEEGPAIAAMLREIYAALQSNLRRVATMGIRALLEHIMIARVGDRGSFGTNLAAFRDAGLVSTHQSLMLERLLEAGHAAMHRMYNPSSRDLTAIVDITEVLVEAVYIHPSRLDEVSSRIPARRRASPAQSSEIAGEDIGTA
jgi:hypothetical protein